MKILLITTLFPGYEGQSRKEISYALYYFVKDWINLGHQVNIIRIWPKYPTIFNLTKKGSNSVKYGKDATFKIYNVEVNRATVNKLPKIDYLQKDIRKVTRKILFHLESDQPDIIVCHRINPLLYISKKIKDELNVPLVLTIHQSDISQLTNFKNKLKKYAMVEPFIDKIGFRSRMLMEQYNSLNFSSENNFLNLSGISKNLVISKEKLKTKIHSRSHVIFIAASMIPLKNIDVVIKAFEKIALNKDIYLKVAGDGPQKKELKKIARDSSVHNKIEFLGYITRESVIEYMENSDVFVMVSSPETFGLVYIEAMATACITIGTKGEGIDGVIKDGENGYICEPRDIDSLANKLIKAINLSFCEKERIITNAVKTAKNMTQESLSKKYLNILKETIVNYEN